MTDITMNADTNLGRLAVAGARWPILAQYSVTALMVAAATVLGYAVWGVAPAASVYPRWARWATLAWTLPLWVALVLGLPRRSLWRWPQVAAPLVVIGLTLVHAVFWTDLRMRAPIVPAIALIAAGARMPVARPHRSEATPQTVPGP